MNRLIIIVCILTSVIIGCPGKEKSKVETTAPKTHENMPGSETIKLKVDLGVERKLQADVDKGHQPWRLEPIDVAHAALTMEANKNIKYENCKLISQTDSDAVVECTEMNQLYIAHLKRLVRNKGIWTATEIEIMKK
jgi:hypothetical protein